MHTLWSIDSQENEQNWCHQMSDFKAEMHKIQFPLGLCPRPRWGAYSAPPDTLAVFKGPTPKGREEKEGRGKEGEGK